MTHLIILHQNGRATANPCAARSRPPLIRRGNGVAIRRMAARMLVYPGEIEGPTGAGLADVCVREG